MTTHRSKGGRALRSDPYTEHRTGTGKVYLAVVLDAWSRRVVGWSIADHIRAELVADAVQMAALAAPAGPGRGVRAIAKDRRWVILRDAPAGALAVVVGWRKRIWVCRDRDCDVKTWTEQTTLAVSASR